MRYTRLKLALMGGTFNPVHNGHLYVASAALRELNADAVLFIPDGDPPHKRLNTPGAARLEMVRIAVAGTPGFGATDMEITRAGTTYTWQTLEELTASRPFADFSYIVGADTLLEIPGWKHPELVLGMCEIAAVMRPGYDPTRIDGAKYELEQRYGARVRLLPVSGPDISSTDIRRRVGRGESIGELVPAGVEDYIIQNGLYAAGKAG